MYKSLDSSRHWASLDQPVKVILESLLHTMPAKCMTAHQVLSEPWLYTAQGLPLPLDPLPVPLVPAMQAEGSATACPDPRTQLLEHPLANCLSDSSLYGSEFDPSSEPEYSDDESSREEDKLQQEDEHQGRDEQHPGSPQVTPDPVNQSFWPSLSAGGLLTVMLCRTDRLRKCISSGLKALMCCQKQRRL